MTYLNRPLLLKYLKHHCLTTIGFDEAFAHANTIELSNLFYMIEEHTSMRTRYNEYIDFLDGNGFKVEGNDTDGYTISFLYN